MSLPYVSGADLPPLGWQHKEALDPSRIEPVGNNWAKPSGGLWTSPIRDGVTAWTEWCRVEDFRDPDAAVTKLTADPDAKVYVVDTHADLIALENTYPDRNPQRPSVAMWPDIDWPAFAADFDAVWLTDAGQWATRFSQPGWYGWDCETVFWMRPRFRIG